MLKCLASAAVLALLASPALAETWHVMGATPAELLIMETDTRAALPNGDVVVWTSSVKTTGEQEPVVKAQWEVSCGGAPMIKPKVIVWYDSDLNSKETWTAGRKDDKFQAVVPGSRGEMTYQYACGKKSWPISVQGSFGEVTGAYANALKKLVTLAKDDDSDEVQAR
ncbi:MAG: hypothetical protein E7812_09210 [Phenylobacterium sp.]|nr:MAG: hypothetical protein E7812_09210 [Phenylobacterium sp.]